MAFVVKKPLNQHTNEQPYQPTSTYTYSAVLSHQIISIVPRDMSHSNVIKNNVSSRNMDKWKDKEYLLYLDNESP